MVKDNVQSGNWEVFRKLNADMRTYSTTHDVNLRRKVFLAWHPFVSVLIGATMLLPRFEGVCYRGICVDWDVVQAEYALGRRVRFTSFSSTTTSLYKAFLLGWSAKALCPEHYSIIVFVMHVRSAVEFKLFSLYQMEEERMLRPWVRFVVHKCHVMTLAPGGGGQLYRVVELVEVAEGLDDLVT